LYVKKCVRNFVLIMWYNEICMGLVVELCPILFVLLKLSRESNLSFSLSLFSLLFSH
jgi:hypothetical protein